MDKSFDKLNDLLTEVLEENIKLANDNVKLSLAQEDYQFAITHIKEILAKDISAERKVKHIQYALALMEL